MNIGEAFKVLGLDINSNVEEIEKKFKTLSKENHPDKGGDNDRMAELLNARELAIGYASNKTLVKIVNEITRSSIETVNRTTEIENEVNSIFRRTQRKVENKLRGYKDATAILGVISGVATLSVSKLLPLVELEENSEAPQIALVFTVLIAISYLIINNRIKKLETRVEDFKDNLNDKEYLHFLIKNIFQSNNSKWLTREEIISIIAEWSDKYGHDLNIITSKVDDLSTILRSSENPKSICRLIGLKVFTKMIMLKGEQHKIIEVKEGKDNNSWQMLYKIV